MSAEKEIVNFWLNRKGYFTVSNIKSGNKDVGILALKFDNGELAKVMHVEVSCSISGSNEQNNSFEKIFDERFKNANIISAIKKYTKNIKKDVEIENVIVLNSISDTEDSSKILESSKVTMIELEGMLSEVMKELKTEYFKNSTIRTLQIVKFLLMSNPKKFVEMMYETLSPAKRRELLAEMLGKDDIIKEFKKTNEERLALILKQAMIKPERLAEILENDVLNRRTRKPFIDSLIQQEKIGRIYKKGVKAKEETLLAKFFN